MFGIRRRLRIVVFAILFVGSVFFVCSCKKAPQDNVSVDTTESPSVKAKANSSAETKESSLGAVELSIELPEPAFVGTPQSLQGVENLEKPLGHARPPFYVPADTTNVAAGMSIASSDEEPVIGEIDMVNDGDKEAVDGSYVELGPGLQSITIDLGAEQNIYAILLWHYHLQVRVYFDVVVQVANDPDFITDVATVFNNDIDNSAGLGIGTDKHYIDTHEGKLIDAKGVRGRYVRFYSNGSNVDELNHYIEVEVFGKPVK
ncbi:MAG: hypothetical protein H8D47_04340 [Planctomycetes bacterium]|nr:hypothetical protein [Planctomycetota bacterium]